MQNPLTKYLQKYGMSPREFAQRHELNYNTVLHLVNGTAKPHLSTLKKIAEITSYEVHHEDMRIWWASENNINLKIVIKG